MLFGRYSAATLSIEVVARAAQAIRHAERRDAIRLHERVPFCEEVYGLDGSHGNFDGEVGYHGVELDTQLTKIVLGTRRRAVTPAIVAIGNETKALHRVCF